MSDRPDWDQWILQKNTEFKEEELRKSDYGPKGAGMYNPIDNIERKKTNVEKVPNLGPNKNAKQYSPSNRGSAKQQADDEAKAYNKKNKKQPVKIYTPEELAEYKKQKIE